MKLEEAEILARRLMAEHGLTGWEFVFFYVPNKSRTAFLRKLHLGYCQFGGDGLERVGRDRYMRVSRKPTISLFAPFVEAGEESMVRSVILHEVAHALAGEGHKHDKIFKQTVNSIGGTLCLTWQEWERMVPAIIQRMSPAENKSPALLPFSRVLGIEPSADR